MLRCRMEGIRDGRAVDRCFYCALLYPNLKSCPRCGNRLHYQPASMTPSQPVHVGWSAVLKQFQENATQEHAQLLLEFLFQNQDELDVTLGSPEHPSLDELRSFFDASQ